MRAARARSQAPVTGFSLVELAVVLFIVGLLMLSLMYTLSAQFDQRNFEETRRRLEQARELVLGFALINGRLPCPARSNSGGIEVRNAAGECKDAASVEDHYGGTLAGGVVGGLLPAVTIGFQPVDSQGFAVDAWGNRVRYAVAKTIADCTGSSTLPHFTNATNLKANGITCKPNDLVVCNVTQAWAAGTACNPGTAVTNEKTIAAIVISTGKNGASGAAGNNETENMDGAGPPVDALFVSRPPDPAGAANGEFDDLLVWIPASMLYGNLISAGVLP